MSINLPRNLILSGGYWFLAGIITNVMVLINSISQLKAFTQNPKPGKLETTWRTIAMYLPNYRVPNYLITDKCLSTFHGKQVTPFLWPLNLQSAQFQRWATGHLLWLLEINGQLCHCGRSESWNGYTLNINLVSVAWQRMKRTSARKPVNHIVKS